MENRAQFLYWTELVELKVGCEYVRRYRDGIRATLTRLAIARSVVSVSALGAWVTKNTSPEICAGVIVLVQVAEAVQRAIPYEARFSGTNDLCASFEALFVEALLEWEDIAAGKVEADEITKRWGRLMTLRIEADRKALPHGLPTRPALMRLATADAQTYFKTMYPTLEL